MSEYISPSTPSSLPPVKAAKTKMPKIIYPPIPGQQRQEELVHTNVFNAKNIVPKRLTAEELQRIEDSRKPPQRTSLPVKLLGALIMWDQNSSVATLQWQGKQSLPVVVGDTFYDKIQITSIVAELMIDEEKKSMGLKNHLKYVPKVYFVNLDTGRNEFVEKEQKKLEKTPHALISREDYRPSGVSRYQPPDSRIQQSSDGTITISKSLVKEIRDNPMSIAQEARAVPFEQNGKIVGFKITAITPGGKIDQLGIKNQDVITRLDGEMMNSLQKVMGAFSNIGKQNSAVINVIRNGKPTNLNYKIQ